jgi:hypothetical protein
MCATVARDHLHDIEANGQTATPARSNRLQEPRCGAAVRVVYCYVVEAIVIVILSVRADLYILLQCGEDSGYGRKTYGGYIEVFRTLLVEDGESSPPASGNFQSISA